MGAKDPAKLKIMVRIRTIGLERFMFKCYSLGTAEGLVSGFC